MIALYIPLIALGSFYLLWVLYLAVMNLKRVKDAGLLSPLALALGYPVFIFGYLLDILINIFVMTFVLLEMPKEFTVTARLKRHKNQSTGWRLSVAKWFEPLLDPFDPSGDHI